MDAYMIWGLVLLSSALVLALISYILRVDKFKSWGSRKKSFLILYVLCAITIVGILIYSIASGNRIFL